MPSTRARSTLRAVSRDEQRATTTPNPSTGPNRAARRKHGWRGDLGANIRAPRPMRRHFGGLLSTFGFRIPTSGQVRIDAKRNARTAYWATLTAQ
jgi:hypothetical protein